MTINKLPDNHPHREITVKPWTNKLMVPRHIVRVDCGDVETTGTHGWQVRYQKPSKFFSDVSGGIRRHPKESLAEATSYLAGIYRGTTSQIKKYPAKRKTNEIQEVGLRLIKRLNKRRKITEIYIEVSNLVKGKSSKRFYVGTENTATQDRISAKLIIARAYREALVKAHTAKRNVR